MNGGFQQTADKKNKIAEALNEYAVLVGEKDERIKIPALKGYAPGIGMKTDVETYKNKIDDIKKGIFKIIAMGEFKNGKSTLINSMIGGRVVVTRTIACTAVITMIVYGKFTNRALVYYKGKNEPLEMPLPEFNEKYRLTPKDEETIKKQGYLDRFADVEYAVIECDYFLCESGVRLIDSPGLGEAISRTKTTMRFVPTANAIIFLLNAARLFSLEERKYIIENFEGKSLKNVFFVVNRMNQISQNMMEIEETKESIRVGLEDVFTDEKGNFNEELYRKRVFFVNALGALEAKENNDLEQLNASGVPQFENELEKFLTSDERLVATFQSALTTMANTYVRAVEEVKNKEVAFKTPIETLEKGRIEAEKILNGLENEITGIEKAFTVTNKIMLAKIYQNLNEYINDMEASWESDSKKLEAKIGLKEMLSLAGSSVIHIFNEEKKKKKQEEIIRPLSQAIGKHIEDKIKVWADQINILVEPELEELRKELKDKINTINLEIGRATKVFTGTIGEAGGADGNSANALQLIISLVQGDVSILVENAAGAGFTWAEFFKKYLIQGIMQIIIFSVMGGPLGLVAFIAMEFYQMLRGAGDLNERILEKLKTKIFSQLRKSIEGKREEFDSTIKNEMLKECSRITQSIRAKLENTKKIQRDIIEEKQKKQFDSEAELKRLQEHLTRMVQLTGQVYYEVYGRSLKEADIYKIAVQNMNKP